MNTTSEKNDSTDLDRSSQEARRDDGEQGRDDPGDKVAGDTDASDKAAGDKGAGAESEDAFYTVVIGTSAGGVHTVQEFFEYLPDRPNMAFVLLQHMAADADSELAELLARHTSIECEWIADGVELAPNHIFVAPPGGKIGLEDGVFSLHKQSQVAHPSRLVDHTFETMAERLGSTLIGVVLTGEGTDGTAGLRLVKQGGGIAMVQDPNEAEHPHMPRNAVSNAMPDVVLPLEGLAGRIEEIARAGGPTKNAPAPVDDTPVEGTDEEILDRILRHVYTQTGHDLSRYKRSSLFRRVSRRQQATGASDLGEYLGQLRTSPSEGDVLLQDILISVTKFLRDPQAFDALNEQAIKPIYDRVESDEEIRIWVPGCATGEEAYSLAMLCHEEQRRQDSRNRLKIFATDIDRSGLSQARRGLFLDHCLENVGSERRARYFSKKNDQYKASQTLRDYLLFAEHNLLQDPPFAQLDLVSCRNLLIYLQSEAQRSVFEIAHYALREGGYLFLGASESAEKASDLFRVVDKEARIYQARADARAPLPTQNLRSGKASELPMSLRRPSKASKARSSESRAEAIGDLHQRVLAEEFAPPSVIIDEQDEIVHLGAGMHRYLRVGEGEPTHNIFDMVDTSLNGVLSSLVYQFRTDGGPQSSAPIQFGDDVEPTSIEIVIEALDHGDEPAHLALVLFRPVKTAAPGVDTRQTDRPREADRRVEQLQQELQQLREKLRVTIEEDETANEELQASNEELLSMNEELQSSTEELETSKEELQSTNEELTAVNRELGDKIEQLDEINNDLENLLSATDIGTIFLDQDLCLKRYTAPVEQYFNVLESDVGRPIEHITRDLEYDELEADARRVIDEKCSIKHEAVCGEDRWFQVRMMPYRTSDGQVQGAVITFVDITDRKAYEGALIDAKEESDRLAQLRTAFVANMSHEIRTPLTSIIGLSQMLGQDLSDQHKEMAGRIRRSAKRLLQTLESVMDVSRMESGELAPTWERFDIVAELAQTVEEIRTTTAVDQVELVWQTPMTSYAIVSDADFVRRIAINLVQNALKFTEQGQAVVRLAPTDAGVCLQVEDTGKGISEDFLPHLFEKFKRDAAGQTDSGYGGSGLGLALVHHMVEALDADISVDSQLGRGSTFSVAFPDRQEPTDD